MVRRGAGLGPTAVGARYLLTMKARIGKANQSRNKKKPGGDMAAEPDQVDLASKQDGQVCGRVCAHGEASKSRKGLRASCDGERVGGVAVSAVSG